MSGGGDDPGGTGPGTDSGALVGGTSSTNVSREGLPQRVDDARSVRLGAQIHSEGTTNAVSIGLQIPPDAATSLAHTHPAEVLALSSQVDQHHFTIAMERTRLNHERSVEAGRQSFELEKQDIADRTASRSFALKVALVAILALLILLGYAGWTGNGEQVGEWIREFLIFAAGLAGGAGGLKVYEASKE